MKPRLAEAAAKRLDEHRSRLQSGPLPAAQKALWEALLRGDIDEALRQSDIVRSIRGPQPPSPLALKLIERFNRLAAEQRILAADVERQLPSKLRREGNSGS